MGTKNNPGQFDCYANALPNEPMFVLLARDPRAPEIVEQWADERQYDIEDGKRPDAELAMIEEARACAKAMRDWRTANDGAWRKPASAVA